MDVTKLKNSPCLKKSGDFEKEQTRKDVVDILRTVYQICGNMRLGEPKWKCPRA